MSDDLNELRRRAEAARQSADGLAVKGGLVGLVDLPERWGVDHSTASAHTKRESFPEPYQYVGDRPLWIAAEVDLWRATPRKPGPRAKP